MTQTGDERGDSGADAAQILPLVYDELRRVASQYFQDERSDHTLQPTALVHELYVRLAGRPEHTWESRAQFFAAGAQIIRRLLVDHARGKHAAKRGRGWHKLAHHDVAQIPQDRDGHLIELNDALTDLEALDPQLYRVVELRFFGGLTIEETAQVLESSPMTVKRQWSVARGWLHREIAKGGNGRR